eukprot:scaffold12357_cov36-Phaeocystis_antarctica.AAC.1
MTDNLCRPQDTSAGVSTSNAGGRAEGGRYRRECSKAGVLTSQQKLSSRLEVCRRPTLLARLRSWPASDACRSLSCSARSSSCKWGRPGWPGA